MTDNSGITWKNRRSELAIGNGMMKYKNRRLEKRLRAGSVERIELSHTLFSRLFRHVKIKIYSDLSRKPWTSIRIPEESAESLIKATVSFGVEIGHIVSGSHSAAGFALTAQRPTLLLTAAAVFTLFARKSVFMNTVAILSLAAAAADILFSFVRAKNISVRRYTGGIQLVRGLLVRKSIYLPERAIVGAIVRSSPAGMICGTGWVSLITSGGSEILCACRVPDGETDKMALRLTGSCCEPCTELSPSDTLRKQYLWKTVCALFMVFLASLLAFRADSESIRAAACAAAILFVFAAIHCTVGMISADACGLKLFSSAVCAAGAANGSYVCYYIRRNCVAGVRISSSLFRRMNDLCSAEMIPKGKRHSRKCECIPYGAVNGLARRFCG